MNITLAFGPQPLLRNPYQGEKFHGMIASNVLPLYLYRSMERGIEATEKINMNTSENPLRCSVQYTVCIHVNVLYVYIKAKIA
jgi:hypothetical protein